MKRILMGLFSWVFAGVLFAGTAAVIPVKPDQVNFKIALSSNPTTGYNWSAVSYNKDLLILTGSHYEAAKTKLMGAGGVMVFEFSCKAKVKRPERTTLVFAYMRPWEKKAVKTTKVDVVFEKAAKK